MLIAFDVDGTLSNPEHRLHYLNPPDWYDEYQIADYKPDWHAFYAAAQYDKPIPEMVELCNALLNEGTHSVIFITGHPEDRRPAMEKWLIKHLRLRLTIHGDPAKGICDLFGRPLLFMREAGDTREEHLIKSVMLDRIQDTHYKDPDIVFDGLSKVVDMFRSEGIRTFQTHKKIL